MMGKNTHFSHQLEVDRGLLMPVSSSFRAGSRNHPPAELSFGVKILLGAGGC